MREELEHRPLLVCGLGLALGLAAVAHWPLFLFVLVLLVAVRPPVLKLAGLVSMVLGLVLAPDPPAQGLVQSQFFRGEATVAAMPIEKPDRTTAVLDWGSARIWTVMPAGFRASMGDRLHVEGIAEPLSEGMDDWALPEGIVGRMRLEPDQFHLVSEGPFLFRSAGRWRQRMLDLTDQSLSPDDAALIDALCFGATGMLDDERAAEIKTTGVGHIVAASGLHVLILGGLLLALFGLLPIPRAISLGLVAVVLLLYACAAGLHPAIVRATIMAIIGSTAYLFRREADALSALSLAAILVLLWQPTTIYQGGFHLTIVVVAALVLFGRVQFDGALWTTPKRILRSIVVAWLASAPIMALEFGFVPVIGLFLNLILVVAVAPIIILAMFADVLTLVWHEGGMHVMRAAGMLTNGLGWMLDTSGGQKWSSFAAPAFSPYWLILLYGVPLVLWRKHLRQP